MQKCTAFGGEELQRQAVGRLSRCVGRGEVQEQRWMNLSEMVPLGHGRCISGFHTGCLGVVHQNMPWSTLRLSQEGKVGRQ